MKLFGDTGKHLHENQERKPKQPRSLDLRAIFHAPVWKKLRAPAIVLGCIVLLVLLVVLIYSIWEKPPETRQNKPNVQPTVAPAVTEPPKETAKPVVVPVETVSPAAATPDPTTQPTETPAKTGRKDNCYTFVILVYDQIYANTDAIMVGRFDTDAGTLDMVNIPRDTLVNVEWGVKRLNTVLPSEENNIDRFLEHLGNIVGFTADCYVVANLKAVEKLVDCFHGVYYNVPRDMDYDDPMQDLHIHIQKGYQLLDGENAVKVMRYRMGNDNSGYLNGDLGRIATQQDLLMTMAAQFLKLGNIPNLDDAIKILQDNMKTNLDASNIAYFAREFLSMDKENITFHTTPERIISVRGGSYMEIEIDEWVEIVNEYLNPFYQEITADNLNILQYMGAEGAVSTTGEVIPLSSFLDYNQYVREMERANSN